jgi:hypothetical protein
VESSPDRVHRLVELSPDALGRHEAENVMTIDEIVELEEELGAANDRLAQHWLALEPGELGDPAVPFEEGPRLLRHRNAVAAVLQYGRDRRARTKDRRVRKNERARQ